MLRRCVFAGVSLAMFLAYAPSAFAQAAVAQLSGTVSDDTGGVLPGVSVTVTQTTTGQTRGVVTGTKGEYVFTNLPVGPYKIAAGLSGFSAFQQTGIVLNVGDARSVNIGMKVGAMTDTVQVEADATMVQTRSVSVSTVVDHEQIVDLPLNGRDATQLILLSGAAVQSNTGCATVCSAPGQSGISISVAGGSGNSTLYLVDGGYNNDPQNNTGDTIPFPDALQEFNAETGVRDARFGQSSSATVNAVTKSGTNAFHGNLFDFSRNHQFNALPYFTRTENGGTGRDDGLVRNQFGGTFGGPVLKDKLFFFEGIQITNNHITPSNTIVTVPTQAVLKGDFSTIMSAACRTSAATLSAPFVNNQVDPALFNPLANQMLHLVPTADPSYDVNGCGKYLNLQANNELDQQYVTRVDYQVTGNKRVFFRDFIATNDHPSAWNVSKPNLLDMTSNGRGLTGRQDTYATGLDWVITQHLFASTRFSYQHTYEVRHHNAGSLSWARLGVNVWNYTNSIDASGKPGPSVNPGQDFIGGGLWSGAITGVFYASTPSVTQSFDWQKGAHSYSWGMSWTRPRSNGDGTFAANGSMGFTGLFTSSTTAASGGLNMADFALGYANTYTGSGSQINNAWVQMPGVYLNDVWRVSRRFTLTYGLRWDPYIAPKDANGFVTAFSRNNYDKGIRSTVYTNAPIGLLFNGDPGFPTNGGDTVNQLKQVAPRLGLVWDPTGSNQQTVRAGAGIYYDTAKLWETAHHMLNAPFGNSVSAIAPSACASVPHNTANGCPLDMLNPWASQPGGDPQAAFSHQGTPVVLAPLNVTFPQNGTYVSMPVNAHPMKQYQWNVSYQWQFLGRMLLDVTYTGNRSYHIWVPGYSENPAVYIPGNCVAGQYALTAAGPCSNSTTNNTRARQILTLLNPTEGLFYGGVSQAYLDATGHYNGVKIALTKRLSNGWSTSTNYTYSKCINQGEPSTDIGGSTFATPEIDPYTNPHPDVSTNEGPCGADRRHLFNLSSVLVSPGLGHGVVKAILQDWQLGLIVQARSGSGITPGVTTNNTLMGGTGRPFIIPGVDPYLAASQRTWVTNNGIPSLTWLNAAAFGPNSAGVNGDVTKSYLFGPGFWNADAAFSRNLNMAGGRRIEIRIEAFNLFNHPNWANPGVSQGSTSLTNGNVTTTTGDPRIMQFALKYGF